MKKSSALLSVKSLLYFAPIMLLAAAPAGAIIEDGAAAKQSIGTVSSADPRATAAGELILRQGGSAADAAMAMMLALTVVEPQSSGIGGGGFLLHFDGDDGALTTIDGRETAPASAKDDLFLDENGERLGFIQAVLGGRSVGTPGNMRLMAKTHEKWGKLKWEALFAPAIKLAEEGFEVNEVLHSRLNRLARVWGEFPAAQKLYWRDGKPAPIGTLIKNPDMANTLRTLAKEGADAFYKGPIAEDIVKTVQSGHPNKGGLQLTDLASYKAVQRDAVCNSYHQYIVCGMGPPSSGASTVLQILGQLERFNLGNIGAENPLSWHLIHESMRLAYADREKYLADADFVSVPIQGLLDPYYLAQRSNLIKVDSSISSYDAGTPPGSEKRTAAEQREIPGTTHFVAADGDGNLVSMTSTIEGPFGSQLISGGFFLNNELTDFTFVPEQDGAPVANRVQGGKRPLSSMSPTIVFDKNGMPILALGSAGGKRIIMHVAKTLVGVLDFGLPLDKAIALPNIYFARDAVQIENGTFLADKSDELAAYGRTVLTSNIGSKVNGAQFIDGKWVGFADPRSPGTAFNE